MAKNMLLFVFRQEKRDRETYVSRWEPTRNTLGYYGEEDNAATGDLRSWGMLRVLSMGLKPGEVRRARLMLEVTP